jgi:hypothetical protein
MDAWTKSVTLYDEAGYLVAGPAERYAVKSGDPLVRGPTAR